VRRLDRERLDHARLALRLRESWRAEREWTRELRGQVQRLYRGGAGTDGGDDVRSLILSAAIRLVEAEKGLLIAREDADDDGDLDVVFAQGFERDPEHSRVAQRFARQVLDRDEIVREDEPRPGDGGTPADDDATAADAEIDSLVAIPLYLRDDFHGVIVCANRPGGFEELDDELLLALGDHAGAELGHDRLEHELRESERSAVRLLAEAAAAHDPVLHRESAELALRAGVLAERLELDQRDRDVLVCATLLRAIGYMTLPDAPRLRPGPLTSEERALLDLHPRVAFNVMSQAPSLRDVATAVLYHHERWDGTGYPAGLAGRDIPLAARAVALLEAYGAMTHERPYRDPWTSERACEALVAGAGSQFDPSLVEVFVEQVGGAAPVVTEDVSEAVLEALPLDTAQPGGVLAGPLIDPLTLLGDRRGLQHDVAAAARHTSSFAVVLIELTELRRVNDQSGFVAGDRMVVQAARNARRAAARLGGTAYRLGGRRFAILVPARESGLFMNVLGEVRDEFIRGPVVRTAMSAWMPGESGEAVLSRARSALRADAAV
jgi:GGDEF domain-containing protein